MLSQMNYQFPTIKTIDDVIPHIEDREEFRVIRKGDYTVINYAVAFEDTFSLARHKPHYNMWMRRECRGLIFDTEGKLISRPYHKFFNVGEREETQQNKINLYEHHVVLEKLDGSMIRPIPTPDGFRLASKAGITDISEQAEQFIVDKPNYKTFILSCFQRNITPIFEWCSRKNRIVIDYPEDQLILTAMRYVFDGSYVTYEVMKNYATSWGIPVVKAFSGSVPIDEDLINHIRKWDDGEGVVIRFDSGHMVKIKTDDYVLRHKTKDQISLEKNVIATILDDSVDDLIPLLTTEDAERLKEFQHAFWLNMEDVATDIHDTYKQIDRGQEQKEFATMAVPSVLPQYQPFMFKLRKGFPLKDLIIEQIQKSVGSQTKIDSVRWLFGNIQW